MGAGFQWSLSGRARWAKRSDTWRRFRFPRRSRRKWRADGRVDAEVDYAANITLKPGETYSTPRSFVSVFAGDFYEPLRIWSSVLQKEGWELPKPSSEAYNVSWCGWGYEFERNAGADAGHGSEAEGDGHQVGDARRSLVRRLWRLESARGYFSRRLASRR